MIVSIRSLGISYYVTQKNILSNAYQAETIIFIFIFIHYLHLNALMHEGHLMYFSLHRTFHNKQLTFSLSLILLLKVSNDIKIMTVFHKLTTVQLDTLTKMFQV